MVVRLPAGAFVRSAHTTYRDEFGARELLVVNPFDSERRLVAKDDRLAFWTARPKWFDNQLFWVDRDDLFRIDLVQGEIATIAEDIPYGAASVCCGGTKLVVGTENASPKVTEAMAQLIPGLREAGWELVKKPYGADADAEGRIIIYHMGSQIWTTDLGSGESRMLMERPANAGAASVMGISPEWRWVAFWPYEGLETMDIDTGQAYLAVSRDSGSTFGLGPIFLGWARELRVQQW